MRKSILFLLSLFLILICSRCRSLNGNINDHLIIKGDGKVYTKSHSINDFSVIEADHTFDIYYSNSSSPSLSVTTDSNVQRYITINEADGVLKLSWTKEGKYIQKMKSLRVDLSSSKLKKVVVSNDIKFHYNNITTTENIFFYGSNYCTLFIKGGADSLTFTARNNTKLLVEGTYKDMNVILSDYSRLDLVNAHILNLNETIDRTSTKSNKK
jgi:hypothetical protein